MLKGHQALIGHKFQEQKYPERHGILGQIEYGAHKISQTSLEETKA